MGKLLNSSNYIENLDNIVTGHNKRLENPFYKFSSNKGTLVTYYHSNTKASTIDKNLLTPKEEIGEDSPFKYDKIENYILHQIDPIQIELQYDESGLQSDLLQGSCVKVLDDSLIPIPGDFFKINQLKEDILWKVINVSPDTLENGNNMWKIDYEISKTTSVNIEKQILNVFTYIFDNVGTELNPFIKDKDYDIIENLDKVIEDLSISYHDLFFNDRVETFIDSKNNYNEYLIEFMIRNEIIFEKPYVAVVRQTMTENKFNLYYNKSIFKSMEDVDNKLYKTIFGLKSEIRDLMSILTSRRERYYRVLHFISDEDNKFNLDKINILSEEVYEKIENNELFEEDRLENIIIKYLNKKPILIDDIKMLKRINYYDGDDSYYYIIPFVLHILSNYGKKIMRNERIF